MIFYVFIMILGLFLIDHFCLYFTEKFKKKKKKKEDKKIFIEDDILRNSKDDIAVDDPLQYIDMGCYYEINKMPKKAIKYYEKAIECGVKKQVVYYFLYRIYKEEKMYDELISLGNDVLVENPYDLVVNESLAYFYQEGERQDIEKACYYYSQVKKIEKINSLMLSAYKEEAKEINQAIKRYKEVINFDFKYSLAYKKLADLYRKSGKIKLAISNYKRAVKMNPQDVYSKLWLGIILGMRGRKKEAQILLNEVIAVDPKDNKAQLAAYAIYYLESNAKSKDDTFKIMFEGELSEVISLFEKEAYENPLDHKVYWKLGMIYFVQEMFEEMRQKFEKVININPSSKEAKFAWCLLNSSFLLS